MSLVVGDQLSVVSNDNGEIPNKATSRLYRNDVGAKKDRRSKKVAVGLSGGVDSSVTAALLVDQGYDVTGVFLECWRGPGCRVDEDRKDALDVALELGIPFKVLDFKKEYYDRVVEYFYSEYEAGRTPNPDTICNREIKFGMFYDWAIEENGFDFVATGHYARVSQCHSVTVTPCHRLVRGADPNKDQSYFLYQLRPEQLAHILFPIGHLTKPEVRQEAERLGLKTAKKPDSQGICFIGPVNVESFLKERIEENVGEIVIKVSDEVMKNQDLGFKIQESGMKEIPDKAHGNCLYRNDSLFIIVGTHQGIAFHTIGQKVGKELDQALIASLCKKGILDFDPSNMPQLFVIEKDVDRNLLIIGTEEETYKDEFEVEEVNWLVNLDSQIIRQSDNQANRTDYPVIRLSDNQDHVFVRIRNTGKIVSATLNIKHQTLNIKTRKSLKGVAPGQACVFYSNDSSEAIVLGGGLIAE